MRMATCETEAIFAELQKIIKLMPRKQQIELACQIEYCFQKSQHLIAEAPTGVGKSLAYLIPAILLALKSNKKVIISTSSKALQKQLVEEDLPLLGKVISFEFALSLGSENYFCDHMLSRSRQLGLFDSAEEMATLERIRALREQDANATVLDCDFVVTELLRQRICRDSNVCTPSCSSKNHCAYSLAAKRQHAAHIIVTNHHKTFHLIKNGSKKLDGIVAIVFDEAHNCEDTATVVFGDSIESKDVIRTITELYDQRSEGGVLGRLRVSREQKDEVIKAVKSVTERMSHLHETANDGGQDFRNVDTECLKQLQSSLVHLGNLLQQINGVVLAPFIARLANFVNSIDSLMKNDKNYIYWKHATNRSWSFTATPLSVSKILRKKLFNAHKIITVHLSATIAVKKSMQFYRSRIGIIDADEMIVDSPFDYRKQAAIYIPNNMPEPRDKGYLPTAIDEIGKLINYFDGRTMVLFTSYRALNETYEILISKFPEFTFLKQADSAIKPLVEKFRKTHKAVLLGAGSFWEGINIPGPALQCVIITKLPFSVPSDPVAKAHSEEVKKRGRLPFWAYQIPRALIRFRQAIGRLIRTETDTGVIAVLDGRIMTRRYGKTFRASLPDCPLIRDIGKFRVR